MLNVVLYRPLIPNNTGTIGRSCLGLGARLHLIRPLGFSLEDKYLKRAGLDYWHNVNPVIHENWDAFEGVMHGLGKAYFFSKQAQQGRQNIIHTTFPKRGDVCLIFGNEVEGLKGVPQSTIDNEEKVYFPMDDSIRSYNLSNTVSMALFEVYRQQALAGSRE